MPRTTKRLLDKFREVEALRVGDRSPSRGMLSRFGKGMLAFLRDYVRILAYHLSVGPFPRVSKIIAAIGLAVSGPGVLYKVIEAVIAGEVRNRVAVIVRAAVQKSATVAAA